MTKPRKVNAGRHTTFSIRPLKVETDPNTRSGLTPLQRNCRFSDELPENMTLFTKYSMEGCKFECMISIRYQSSNDCNLEKKYLKTDAPSIQTKHSSVSILCLVRINMHQSLGHTIKPKSYAKKRLQNNFQPIVHSFPLSPCLIFSREINNSLVARTG